VILHDLRQKSDNTSALAQWILDQVPFLETSLVAHSDFNNFLNNPKNLALE
jgi:hypothetical protein